MNLDAESVPGVDSAEGHWSLIKVLDLVAAVLLTAVVVEIVGAVLAGAGYPSSHIAGVGTPSIPSYLRLEWATQWAGPQTGLLLLAGLAAVTLPRIVWRVPTEDTWPRAAFMIVAGICGVAALAAGAGLVGVGNTIWNTPDNTSFNSWNVAAGLAGVLVNGLAGVLARFALPYAREGSALG